MPTRKGLTMTVQLTKPLVVPEFKNAQVRLYVAHPVTLATIPVPSYTIDIQSVVTALFPGRTAAANSCALHGSDLFISNSGPDSQCVFKVPDYLVQGGVAKTQMFVFTLDSNDYVGMALDPAGDHLYVAGGNAPEDADPAAGKARKPGDNHILRYEGTSVAYPGP